MQLDIFEIFSDDEKKTAWLETKYMKMWELFLKKDINGEVTIMVTLKVVNLN